MTPRESSVHKGFLPLPKKLLITIGILCVLLCLSALVAIIFGVAKLDVPAILIKMGKSPGDFGGDDKEVLALLFYLRLPRILLAALVGATLALGGAVFQSLFRNPLAEPYVLGVSGGAALGAVLSITLAIDMTLLGLPLGAFVGALVATGLILLISAAPNVSLNAEEVVLSGVVINAFFSAIIVFTISISSAAEMQSITFWLMGDLALIGYEELLPLALIFLSCFIVIYWQARNLNALMLGEESAIQLGVPIRLLRNTLVIFSSLAIGAAVSLSGIIGFVGVIVPHLVKMSCGLDNRIVLPASALLGACFLILADVASRTLLPPSELPIGVVTAVVGVPFFILLLWKKHRCS